VEGIGRRNAGKVVRGSPTRIEVFCKGIVRKGSGGGEKLDERKWCKRGQRRGGSTISGCTVCLKKSEGWGRGNGRLRGSGMV